MAVLPDTENGLVGWEVIVKYLCQYKTCQGALVNLWFLDNDNE